MPPSTLYSEQSRKPDLHPGEARKEGFKGHPFLLQLRAPHKRKLFSSLVFLFDV